MQVLVHVVSALFDMTPSLTTHMPVHLWKKCIGILFQILELLKANSNIIMDETYDGGEEQRTGVWHYCFISCHETNVLLTRWKF